MRYVANNIWDGEFDSGMLNGAEMRLECLFCFMIFGLHLQFDITLNNGKGSCNQKSVEMIRFCHFLGF